MSAPANIEHFNRVVLVTLDQLYDAFPVPTELKTAEIADVATPGTLPPEPSFNDLEATFEAIQFLSAEGFLKYAEHYRDGTAFLHAQLTMKGLTVLGQVPNSLDKKPALASQIKTALKAGALSATTDAAKQLVGQIFTAAIAAGPSLGSSIAAAVRP
ncbi:MAG: hypothetical protein DI603_03385 [Roseateles depolymerans]|uniref:Uncharacterized protein n=1 Tax=Roseateles depolymerans TaxID=76731 RepID=A0A2W5FXT4_9BURK|nr:MAG: hypothetical protein DI603_03385 [Roseateles depolymerans]